MVPTVYTALGLATHILSVAGTAILNTIFAATTIWVPGSQIITGNTIILPDSSTTTSPAVYLNDETTAIETKPITVGTEYCYGHTGALLCTTHVKLTGSGGHRNHNAGSFICSTSTCSIVSARVLIESGSDVLYGGWTTNPGGASGAQVFNHFAPHRTSGRGGTIHGSGTYAYFAGSAWTTVAKDVPPGATFKFTWKIGNSTEDYSRTIADAIVTYWKGYNP